MSDPLTTGKSLSLSSDKSKRLSWGSCVIIAAASSADYRIDLILGTLQNHSFYFKVWKALPRKYVIPVL